MKTPLSFVLILLCAVVAMAQQERNLTKSEFDTVIKGSSGHQVKWKGETYRMTVVTSAKQVNQPQTDWSSNMIFEYGPESAQRSVTTSTFGSNPPKTTETLRIGKWVYTRSGSDPWKRKEYAPSEANRETTEDSAAEVVRTNSEYKDLGTTTLMDKTVRVYRWTEHQSRTHSKTGMTYESDVRNTYWIDADGIMLKSEYYSEGRNSTGPRSTSVITTWERDPSIKFSEPDFVS